MESTFENILENWINGNKSDVRKMVDKLTSNEQYQFKNWLREQYEQNNKDHDLFEMLLFIAFA